MAPTLWNGGAGSPRMELPPTGSSSETPWKKPFAGYVEFALRATTGIFCPEPSVPELYPNMSNADDAKMMLELKPAELEPGVEEGRTHQPVGQRQEVASG